MITLAFAQMAYFVAQSLDMFGGSDGMPTDPPTLFGTALLRNRTARHAAVLVLLIALTMFARMLGASPFGRVLRAARESDRRVTAAGLNIRHARLAASTLAGAIGALAGWLLALHAEFVSPAMMEWRISGELLVMVILGGAATPEGAALGAIALTLGEAALAGVTEHWRMILGPLIVLLALTGRWQRRPA